MQKSWDEMREALYTPRPPREKKAREPKVSPIKAIASGTVEMTGTDTDYGQYVRIYHPQLNCHSFYAHLSSIHVAQGQPISLGQLIGLMGSTGNSTGSHLHFEIRFGERDRYWDVTYRQGKGRANPEALFALYGLRF